MKMTDRDALLNPLPFCHERGGFTIRSHAILCECKMVIMGVFNRREVFVKELPSTLATNKVKKLELLQILKEAK